MFTHAEYELLRKRCPAELEAFLSSLALTAPSLWDDATRVKQLDTDATRCIAQKLHSTSLLDGCYTLLEDAGLPFDFSETTQTILERIAEHRAEVRAGMTKARPTPTAGEGRTAPEPRCPARGAATCLSAISAQVSLSPISSISSSRQKHLPSLLLYWRLQVYLWWRKAVVLPAHHSSLHRRRTPHHLSHTPQLLTRNLPR